MSVVMEINPFDFFADKNGAPLDAGYIWIGEPNKFPKSFPVAVYYDAALTVPAQLPLRTTNGYVVRNGAPTFLYINGNYSVLVENKTNQQIFYVADVLLIGSSGAVSFADLANNSDPTKGAGLVGLNVWGSPKGLGRTLPGKFQDEVWVSDFIGYDPTGATDSWPAFQAATDKAASLPFGGVVRIPCGNYTISGGGVTNNRAADPTRKRVSWVGADQNGVRINYSGTPSACFSIFGNPSDPSEGNASHEMVSDMTILGPAKRANSAGVYLDLCSFARAERLNVQNFDFGFYFQDVDQFSTDNVLLRFNNKGWFARKNPAPTSASTQPNNYSLKAITIANNSEYGALWVGGSSIHYISGDVEYNGSDASGWGLKGLDMGYEGSTGLVISPSVYFEGNRGIADVFIEALTVNATPLLDCTHTVFGNFKRLGNAFNSTNHIAMAIGPSATVGNQRLVTLCGFKEYPGYTPSGATLKVRFTNSPATSSNYFDLGSGWGSPVEKPAFVQSINKIETVVSKNTAQTFTSGVTAQWALDTAFAPTPTWTPAFSAGDLIIPETGTYSVSALAILNLSASGLKFMTISRNGGIIAYAESTGTSNVCCVSATVRFTANDVLRISFSQTTGANLDIAGSSTALSNVTLAKIYGQ